MYRKARQNPLVVARARLGISQERLAVLSGYGLARVAFYDRNPEVMTMDAAEAFARILDVDAEELLARSKRFGKRRSD